MPHLLTHARNLKTFYRPSLDFEGITLAKCGLGILSVLESIGHPFIETVIHGKDVHASAEDIWRALYIFAFSREARAAVALGKLDESVEAWVEEIQISASAMTKSPPILIQMIRDAVGSIPTVAPTVEAGAAPIHSEESSQPSASA